jgi:hypothetical protein
MRALAKLSLTLFILLFGASFAAAFGVKDYAGRFIIEFPGEPTVSTHTLRGQCGPTHYDFVYKQGSRVYQVRYSDCKPTGFLSDMGVRTVYKNMMKLAIDSIDGQLRSSDPVEQGLMSAREFTAFIPRGKLVMRERIYVEGDRVYQNIYIGPDGTDDEPEVNAFFASFKIIR